MADEGGSFWDTEGEDLPPPANVPAEVAPAEAAPATQVAAAVEEALPPQGGPPRDPNKLILFRHWSRPTRLQYNYLYDYRHNYYDDVIDYLDRRTRGITRDIPRAQTWAERALRTYTTGKKTAAVERRQKDVDLLYSIRASNNYYVYHSRDYITKRYPALLL